jgi:hypothetical protein
LRTTPHRRLPLLDGLLLSISRRRTIDGFSVATMDDAGQASASFEQVEEALHLIRDHAPRLYGRLRCDLELIWVRVLPGPLGGYNHALRACLLDARFVLDHTRPCSLIAASIVHEGTHARLRRCGIDYREPIRNRVEAVCVRAEMDFAARLPDGAAVRTAAEGRLRIPTGFWTDDAFAQRHLAGMHDAIKILRVPFWLGWWLLQLGRVAARARRSRWAAGIPGGKT